MKLFKYLPFALAIAAMVGCSDDSFVETPLGEVMEDGGYVDVRLHLPSMTGRTRMTDDKDLSDGTNLEYGVNGGAVLLFNNETDPKVIVNQPYSASELGFTMNGEENITSSSTKVMIPDGSNKPTYILALLNLPAGLNSIITAIEPGVAYSTIVAEYAANGGAEASAVLNGYHFMSNSTFDNNGAPLSVYRKENTGSSKLQSLQEIDPNSIANSKTAIVSSTTNVYVERASVKVDIEFKMDKQTEYSPGSSVSNPAGIPTITYANEDVLEVLGWAVTVRNKSFYPVKQIVQDTWNNWLDNKKFYLYDDINGNQNYRSYWAMDPQYVNGPTIDSENQGYFTNFTYVPFESTTTAVGQDNPQYCLENTFRATNQNQNQTTAILVTAQYKVGGLVGNVYTMSGEIFNGTKFIISLVDKMNMLGYTNGEEKLKTTNFELLDKSATENNNIYKNIVKYIGDNDLRLGNTKVIDLTKTGDEDQTITGMDGVLNTFGNRSVAYYANGKCYYTIPIRHFTNAEVPLSNADNQIALEGEGSTEWGINKQHQEGRYGVVRNHWYSVSVSSIKQLGRPTPVDPTTPINPDPSFPDPTDPVGPNVPSPTPDDVEEIYIDAQINILPWARRSQNADL